MWFTEKQIDFFKILSNHWVDIISWYKKLPGWYYLNPYIFKEKEIPEDFHKHKEDFLEYINRIKYNLNIFTSNNLNNSDIENIELNYLTDRIEFLSNLYDTESLKIWNIIKDLKPINIDYYNDIFFKITNDYIKNNFSKEIFPVHWEKTKQKISKLRLIELLELVKLTIPELNYTFWDFSYMAHSKWTLKIPDKTEYSIKNIIVLFFHELTHFLRRQNQINNYGFDYSFSDYMDFEEWIALYNEYYYWNLLINWWYWEYFPIYDYLYSILKYSSLNDKKQLFKDSIIKLKWVSDSIAEDYYYRFYRYTNVWWDKFFLKESCYSRWLTNVKNELQKDKNNYNKIMSGRIWFNIYNQFDIYWEKNNSRYLEWVFETIKKELKF